MSDIKKIETMNKELNTPMEIRVKLKTYRRINGISQEGLAEVSGISLRTIQRLEKGLSIGSAYTLSTLAKALKVDTTDLTSQEPLIPLSNYEDRIQLKWLNLSTLCVVLIPLSNIIIPAIIFWRHKDKEAINTYGRKILSFQILWLLTTLLMMVVIPLILLILFKPLRGGGIPLFVPIYLVSVMLDVYLTIRFALDINDQSSLIENLPNLL